jgi:hypothetical protein
MEIYNFVKSGNLAGSTSTVQMPDIPCRKIWFQAQSDNIGNVYIGGAGVTKTISLKLPKSELLGPIEVENLSTFYRITDFAGDNLVYLATV